MRSIGQSHVFYKLDRRPIALSLSPLIMVPIVSTVSFLMMAISRSIRTMARLATPRHSIGRVSAVSIAAIPSISTLLVLSVSRPKLLRIGSSVSPSIVLLRSPVIVLALRPHHVTMGAMVMAVHIAMTMTMAMTVTVTVTMLLALH